MFLKQFDCLLLFFNSNTCTCFAYMTLNSMCNFKEGGGGAKRDKQDNSDIFGGYEFGKCSTDMAQIRFELSIHSTK